jgi:hypothetical protein
MPEQSEERNKKMKPCVDCSTDEPELVTVECSTCRRDWLFEVQCRGCMRRTGLHSDRDDAFRAWESMR